MNDEASIKQAVVDMGLATPGGKMTLESLAGGVSCDIWRVDTAERSLCVKRARSKLSVSDEWYAPVERNAFEVAWYRIAADVIPDAVPEILGHLPAQNIFAMEYFPPDKYLVWKSQLRDGLVDERVPVEVAKQLVAIHNATAGNESVAKKFATDEIFFALRVEPYLLATAKRHASVANSLEDLAKRTMASKIALVHGDVSPKNILVGERGPVILDAECAWYGEPAFDIPFCLNLLLLKCIWNPSTRAKYLRCFDLMAETYTSRVEWEPRSDLERRAAELLPALMLARVDGKSPVEYIVEESDKQLIRRFAIRLLQQPVTQLLEISKEWESMLSTEAVS